MKNIFRYSILLALCSFVGLVSCAPEELSTDQFSDDAVVFGAFAPNPVVLVLSLLQRLKSWLQAESARFAWLHLP